MSDKNKPILKIDKSGTKRWYLNGKLHREDGPAVEEADGTKEYYLNGKQLSYSDWAKQTMKLSPETDKAFRDVIDGLL